MSPSPRNSPDTLTKHPSPSSSPSMEQHSTSSLPASYDHFSHPSDASVTSSHQSLGPSMIQPPSIYGSSPSMYGSSLSMYGSSPSSTYGSSPSMHVSSPFAHGASPFVHGSSPFVHGSSPSSTSRVVEGGGGVGVSGSSYGGREAVHTYNPAKVHAARCTLLLRQLLLQLSALSQEHAVYVPNMVFDFKKQQHQQDTTSSAADVSSIHPVRSSNSISSSSGGGITATDTGLGSPPPPSSVTATTEGSQDACSSVSAEGT